MQWDSCKQFVALMMLLYLAAFLTHATKEVENQCTLCYLFSGLESITFILSDSFVVKIKIIASTIYKTQ